MVSFQNRFNPGSLLIKNTLDAGELGKILSARAMVTWDRSDDYYQKSDWKGTWEKRRRRCGDRSGNSHAGSDELVYSG